MVLPSALNKASSSLYFKRFLGESNFTVNELCSSHRWRFRSGPKPCQTTVIPPGCWCVYNTLIKTVSAPHMSEIWIKKHERLKPCETAEVALWLREAVSSCSRSVVDEERLYIPSFWSYHMCANINSLATVVASGLITYYQCYLFPKGAVRELSLTCYPPLQNTFAFNLSLSANVWIFPLIIMQLMLCMISKNYLLLK